MICDNVSGIGDPFKLDLALSFCRNKPYKKQLVWSHLVLSWTQKDCFSSYILVLRVSLKLTLIQKRDLCLLRLLPLMTEFSVFMPLQGIAPGNSWLGRVSLKDYKIIWKKKSEGNENKMIQDRNGENKTQRLYRCCSNYALLKLIVDNGLEDLLGRENLDSPEFTRNNSFFGKDPG